MWKMNAHSKIMLLPALLLGILISGSANSATCTSGACPIGGYAINACPVVTDAVIRDQIISRLSGSVASTDYPVVVGVCDGQVTLQGRVQTAGKRDLASIFAASVRVSEMRAQPA